jgi:hypothetical protein
LEIIEPAPDRITAFEFLRATLQGAEGGKSSMDMVIGTLYGRISVYSITKNGYNIVRTIPHAHN